MEETKDKDITLGVDENSVQIEFKSEILQELQEEVKSLKTEVEGLKILTNCVGCVGTLKTNNLEAEINSLMQIPVL